MGVEPRPVGVAALGQPACLDVSWPKDRNRCTAEVGEAILNDSYGSTA